jgi:CDP-4-dehydro-6-deoxyglucose reductase, E3
MSFRITIQPSAHVMENHPGESLLESALMSGLPVDYGCSNGNCGRCRARLVDGEIERVRHSDFVFPRMEADAGWFLMCCHGARSDVVIDTGIASGSGDIPLQEIEVKVRKVAPLDEEYFLLHVQTPRTRRLRFLAGQGARLSRGEQHCTLPIASCPCDDRNIHFHIPRQGAPCDAAALSTLRAGDTLNLNGPIGDFVLDAVSTRPRIMIGAGDGMAPLKSIVEHSLALAPAVPVSLLLVENASSKHYLHNLLRSWQDALDNFTWYSTDSGDAHCADEVRAFTASHAADPTTCDFYLCGPAAFIDAASSALGDWPIPAANIHRCAM